MNSVEEQSRFTLRPRLSDRSSGEERDDGGVVQEQRHLERGLVLQAADRFVRAVLEQLRDDGGVAVPRRAPFWRCSAASGSSVFAAFRSARTSTTGTSMRRSSYRFGKKRSACNASSSVSFILSYHMTEYSTNIWTNNDDLYIFFPRSFQSTLGTWS